MSLRTVFASWVAAVPRGRRTGRAALSFVLVGAVLASCTSVDENDASAPEAGVDVYSFAGGCHALEADGSFIGSTGDGWSATADRESASAFRMQATRLGSYLLYGPDGQLVAADGEGAVSVSTEPGPDGDWRVDAVGDAVELTNVATGNALVVADGRLVQSEGEATAWTIVEADGCAEFPDIDPGVDGEPFTGESSDAVVRGFLDAHTHLTAFQFLGGEFHCGRPWSPYGVEVALRDCDNHADGEIGSITDGLLSGGDLSGVHDQAGWPTFTGWPNTDSLTHEGTYWRWIERAWRGGLRLMVTHLVDNRALCEIFPMNDGSECNDMANVRDQAQSLRELEGYIDAQAGGPGNGFFRIVESPREARETINDGKLAVVMGVEVSEVFDCGLGDGPDCDESSIDAGLDELYELGVRSVFPVHKFDNALGGTMYDPGLTGVFVNVGNRHATGEYWAPRTCEPGETPDNTVVSPASVLSGIGGLIADLLGDTIRPLIDGDLPTYPEPPHCNPNGLSDLGRHAIEGLVERGMIVETDHLSAKARADALDVLERLDHPGLISSHTWDDAASRARLQALGGLVAPYAGSGFADEWRATRDTHPDRELVGLGYASDTNGLAPQPDPRDGNAANPVTYPFTSFDGATTIHRQVSGTRTYDLNDDGAAHYGLFVDWIEDLRITAGDELIDDLASGAEAYLQMWERATSR